ncbi:MAG: hypothetical protein WBL61_10145 [Bryobacteraceae bacterium]
MRLLSASVLSLAIAYSAFGQTYTIDTIAGGGLPVNLPATSATLGYAAGVAVDSSGSVLVALTSYNMVVRIDPATGNLTPIAGTGTAGYSGDNGPATSAQLNAPIALAVDNSGNLYIADTGNAAIREVSNGTITTFGKAGTLVKPSNAGSYPSGYFSQGIAVDGAGNVYIADTHNNRITEASGTGVVAAVAGSGGYGYSGDGLPASSASLRNPTGVAVDGAGNVYIADTYNNCVREISGGIINTVAGTGTGGYNGDNIKATNAQLWFPDDVAVDGAGNLYIADAGNSRVRKVTNGIITTTVANPGGVEGIALDAAGNLYITTGSTVLKAAKVSVTTIAGGGAPVAEGSSPTGAQLNFPESVAVDSSGNVYIADTNNRILRKLSNGTIADVPGNWFTPGALTMDAAGNLYMLNGSSVVEITPAGVVTTVAGTGPYTYSYNGDNIPATSATLAGPSSIAVDSAGNLYIADTGNSRVRKVSGGLITTVAGTGVSGYNGNNVPASTAQLSYPGAVAVDNAGNLYISDSAGLREVSDGIIAPVDAVASTIGYSSIAGLATDSAGNLYIADPVGSRVDKMSGGTIVALAGDGAAEFSGDGGPAGKAEVDFPSGVAVDSSGTVYVADSGDNRIRVLTPSGSPCMFSVSPQSFAAVAANGGNVTVNIQASSGCTWGIPGLPLWIAASKIAATGSGSSTLTVTANPGAAPRSALLTIGGTAVLLTQQGSGNAPSINPAGVLNAASYTTSLAAGGIASAFATFPVSQMIASGSPLPTSLSGLSLQVNGATPVPLYFVSSTQVNFQVPWELSGQAQTLMAATVGSATSAGQVVNLAPFAPAIFAMNAKGTGQGAITDASYNLVDSSNPATAGSSYILIYCTGLGGVTNQPPTGSPALADPLSWTTTIPTVTIGGAPASVVSFYGLAPGYAGLYQVNAQVPAGSAKGNAVPVTISMGGATSNAVTIAVQ